MASPSRTAIVAGSTGLIGSHILSQLLADARYGKVIALSRKALPISHPKLQIVAVTLDSLPDVAPTLIADDWFCALGTTIRQAGSQEAFRKVDYDYPLALGKQAAASGAKQFLLVSAIGASSASSIFYSRVKGEVERDLCQLGLPRLHVFRPSLLMGERTEHRRSEKLWGVLMKGLNPLLLGRFRKYRAIQATDVAAAMIRAANRLGKPGIHMYEGKQMFDL
jgi:uncharacterized protein YbjT (DUF2867 family)